MPLPRPQSLLSCADSTADLREAEVLLRRAVAVAERLAGAQGDPAGDGNGSRHDSDTDLPLADANAACRRECKAGDEARRALAMLLCQQGRDDEAAGHLKQLGYTHRLARQVGRLAGPPWSWQNSAFGWTVKPRNIAGTWHRYSLSRMHRQETASVLWQMGAELGRTLAPITTKRFKGTLLDRYLPGAALPSGHPDGAVGGRRPAARRRPR